MTDFLIWPDKRLRTAAAPVETIDDEVKAIWDRMIAAMDAMPGYGLAAVQLGIMRRLAVVDCSTQRGKAIRMANPEIIDTSSEMRSHEEASPNLPGASAKIKRPNKVIVRYLSPAGVIDRAELEGIWATSVQHQIDHLNGKMFFDRLSNVKRSMLLKKWEKRNAQ